MSDVLVVDDDAATCRTVARLLRAFGHPSQCLESGSAVLRYLANDTPPKLILLDVMMPGIDGLAVLRAIRGEPSLASIRVVMYTAISDVAIRQEAERLGIQGYIVKGRMDFDELYDHIRPYVE